MDLAQLGAWLQGALGCLINIEAPLSAASIGAASELLQALKAHFVTMIALATAIKPSSPAKMCLAGGRLSKGFCAVHVAILHLELRVSTPRASHEFDSILKRRRIDRESLEMSGSVHRPKLRARVRCSGRRASRRNTRQMRQH